MKTSKVVSLFIAIIGVGTVIWFGINFRPGSYPYVEEYTIDASESDAIDALRRFKINNPHYNVPEYLEVRDGRERHWYHVYFYYPENKQIVHAWLRQSEKEKTTFAFVGINHASFSKGMKFINKDYSRVENREEKEKFEKRFVAEIRRLVKNKKQS